ncbi:hypothetical protein KAU08_01995 [bacterium]|nr:hypothetical protein [bacterium]
MHLFDEKKGIVAIIDGLGASEMESQVLYERIKRLIGAIKDSINEIYDGEVRDKINETLRFSVFNDTIIIFWEFHIGMREQVFAFSTILNRILWKSLEIKFPIRGAVGLGPYFLPEEGKASRDEFYILGSVINDAAKFHQIGDWIGIILTPNFSKEVKKWTQELDPGFRGLDSKINNIYFPEYPVPTKKPGDLSKIRVVGWPMSRDSQPINLNRDELREFFNITLDRFNELVDSLDPIPEYAKPKYENTRDFIKWCFEHATRVLLGDS